MAARTAALLDHIIRHHSETMGAVIVAVMMDTSGALFSKPRRAGRDVTRGGVGRDQFRFADPVRIMDGVLASCGRIVYGSRTAMDSHR